MRAYEAAPLPANEQERLAELHLLKLLDTAAEERFNRFTQFAANLFRLPISLISLIDQNRQWFKSACGLSTPETDRDIAFCAHAILEPELLVIPDASLDKRFFGNPLVTNEPYIRFYAGAVLHGPSGQAIGTLCLIDQQPREFSHHEQTLLLQLARLVEHELQHGYKIEQIREQIEAAAYYDTLTGLPNKRLLQDRLRQALTLARRTSLRLLVIHIDIDRFTAFNSTFGQDKGDIILKKCSERLKENLDASCTISRTQNDQFTLLIPLITEMLNPESIVKFVHQQFERPFHIEGRTYSISASSGISVYPNDSIDAESLYNKATLALHHARSDTNISYQFYCEKVNTNLVRRTHIASRLRSALAERKLELVYQPIIDLKSGHITGVEALCRWHDTDFGPIPPDEFIPVAEATGIIHELSYWVLNEVCTHACAWRAAGFHALKVAINITSNQIRLPNFPDSIKKVLTATSFDANCLILELTESCFIDDPETTIKHMSELRALGVSFAIDDFGIGFSSFSYLQNLPAQILKLDRTFIAEMTNKYSDATIAHAIIAMAKNLNLSVTAEGVENVDQLIYLKAYHCDEFQGYLFSPPVSAEAFTIQLIDGKCISYN